MKKSYKKYWKYNLSLLV